MRRWILRASITFVILITLAMIAVQIVLTTNLPRDLVLGEVQRTLGLQIGAESLGTGWFGHTSLHGVTLSLPLAGESFLRVKSLNVRHTILPAILFGRPVKLQSLEFESPELMVRQDSNGQWNVSQVIDLLRRAGGDNRRRILPTPRTRIAPKSRRSPCATESLSRTLAPSHWVTRPSSSRRATSRRLP